MADVTQSRGNNFPRIEKRVNFLTWLQVIIMASRKTKPRCLSPLRIALLYEYFERQRGESA